MGMSRMSFRLRFISKRLLRPFGARNGHNTQKVLLAIFVFLFK